MYLLPYMYGNYTIIMVNFTRADFQLLAVLAIDMKLTEEQKNIYVANLKRTNINFNEDKFRKAMMIEYNNRHIAGEFAIGGI